MIAILIVPAVYRKPVSLECVQVLVPLVEFVDKRPVMRYAMKNRPKTERGVVSRYLHALVLRQLRSRFLKITGITLKRVGIWTEVWANVDGEETFLMREIYDDDFHHSITQTGITGCRYDSQNAPEQGRG